MSDERARAGEFIRAHRWASRTPQEQIPALVDYLVSTCDSPALVRSDEEYWGDGPRLQAALLLGIEWDQVKVKERQL